MLSTSLVGTPGAHGAAITGVQGAGVNNTGGGLLVAGLATELHMPKGGMLATGLLSMILAIGAVPAIMVGLMTMSAAGAVPKLHFIVAPIQTAVANVIPKNPQM